jgi:hypothetical protein
VALETQLIILEIFNPHILSRLKAILGLHTLSVEVGRYCRNLETISVTFLLRSLDAQYIMEIMQNNPKLTSISLSVIHNDNVMANILQSVFNIRSKIGFFKCSFVGHAESNFFRYFPVIKHLSIYSQTILEVQAIRETCYCLEYNNDDVSQQSPKLYFAPPIRHQYVYVNAILETIPNNSLETLSYVWLSDTVYYAFYTFIQRQRHLKSLYLTSSNVEPTNNYNNMQDFVDLIGNYSECLFELYVDDVKVASPV